MNTPASGRSRTDGALHTAGPGGSPVPPQAYAVALAALPDMTVHRLLALLRHHPPEEAFAIAAGYEPPRRHSLIERVFLDAKRGAGLRELWRAEAVRHPPEAAWERCVALGLEVSVLGDAAHPAVLVVDPLPVPVLFSRGDRSLLDGRRAALVGTRNATAAGRHLARHFGAELAGAGVHVVSGLARGIDGAAHRGALDALDVARTDAAGTAGQAIGRPVAVVASGLDVVYPREHRDLWQRVATDGLLLSEHPPGTAPLAHHFPQRNRLVAALSEVVVVVESRERGGSLITADLATERGVPVMAVPGTVVSRASAGTNALLRDGAAPVLDVGDVLLAMQLDRLRFGPVLAERRPRPRRDDLEVLRACSQLPRTIGDVARCVDRPLLDVAMAVARLEQSGWLFQVDGWYETLGSPPP